MELLPSIARNKQIHVVLFTDAAGLEWFATLCHPPDAVLSEAGLLLHDAAVVQKTENSPLAVHSRTSDMATFALPNIKCTKQTTCKIEGRRVSDVATSCHGPNRRKLFQSTLFTSWNECC